MSDRGLRSSRVTSGRALVGVIAVLGALVLTACDPGAAVPGAQDDPSGSSATASETPAALQASVKVNVGRGARDVPVDRQVAVTVSNAELDSVEVSSAEGSVAGEMAADGFSWRASELLEPGTAYAVKTVAHGTDGATLRRTTKFTTQDLTLEQQTYPSVAPLADETVGVGMPVIVTFDVAVTDRASIEKHLSVTSKPSQAGAWHWLSDNEVHVDADINGVSAGNGIYGQESRVVDFEVGDAHVYKVNAQTHQMRVLSNGKLLRTIPITTGKAGFTTRSGTKVIIEKFESKRMNSETVGIGGSEAYDIDNVQYAMRLTYSGEFIHAAPWSVGSQGYANVSHGCTGMSTADAGWLYGMSRRGDVVEYVGTDRPMTLDNGYGDWNESFVKYEKGSALS